MSSEFSVRLKNLFGPADDLNDPLWHTRFSPAVCAFFFVLAETAFRTGNAHPIVFAMGWTQLISLSFVMIVKVQDIVTAGSSDALMRPVWMLRILPLVCAASILGSEFYKVGGRHGALLGFSSAMLVTILAIGFSTTEVILRPSQLRDEIQQLHLTR